MKEKKQKQSVWRKLFFDGMEVAAYSVNRKPVWVQRIEKLRGVDVKIITREERDAFIEKEKEIMARSRR